MLKKRTAAEMLSRCINVSMSMCIVVLYVVQVVIRCDNDNELESR